VTAISKNMSVADLAALVCQHLADRGIEAVLTGGAVVTIYSENEYRSDDLDFICTARQKDLTKAMVALGFKPDKGRYFVHPDTNLFIEFPAPPLAIGNEPVTEIAEQWLPTGILKLLTPTQCVMDRLAAFYHWNDQQARRQAAMVAARHAIDWNHVERWSRSEGCLEKYQAFRSSAMAR
jgi:hypothetical protein